MVYDESETRQIFFHNMEKNSSFYRIIEKAIGKSGNLKGVPEHQHDVEYDRDGLAISYRTSSGMITQEGETGVKQALGVIGDELTEVNEKENPEKILE